MRLIIHTEYPFLSSLSTIQFPSRIDRHIYPVAFSNFCEAEKVERKKKKDEVVENTLFARIYFNTRVRSTSDARCRDALTSAV